MSATGTVRTEGADLAYDYQGDGPVLLLISGGGGDAGRYARISSALADEYTVVSYDRRCNSRSTGDAGLDLDMAQQARDAAAVIKAMGAERAFVFGNSGGANIAFQLAADDPGVISGLVAHEGPTMAILPDADTWMAFIDNVHATFLAHGAGPAMKLFASKLVGFDTPEQAPIAAGGLPPNGEFFLAKEYVPISRYRPDLDAIRRNGVPAITAAGRESADAYYARTARVQAELLGCRYVEFPGNHLGFIFDAVNFSEVLRGTLRDLAR